MINYERLRNEGIMVHQKPDNPRREGMKCYKCGGELSTGDNDGVCGRCRNRVSVNVTEHLNGWICPKCGSVYNPSITQCYKCNAIMGGEK